MNNTDNSEQSWRQLIEKFPNVFRKLKHIEAPLGWFTIIHNLCEKLEPIFKNYPEVYAGQIKEKFGGLRFYVDSLYTIESEVNRNHIESLIQHAEEEAYATCDVCGKPGEMHNFKGQYATLCNQHKF